MGLTLPILMESTVPKLIVIISCRRHNKFYTNKKWQRTWLRRKFSQSNAWVCYFNSCSSMSYPSIYHTASHQNALPDQLRKREQKVNSRIKSHLLNDSLTLRCSNPLRRVYTLDKYNNWNRFHKSGLICQFQNALTFQKFGEWTVLSQISRQKCRKQ